MITALSSKYTGNKNAWGCLSDSNLLFQIATLSYTRIPDRIVDFLVREGKIWIKKEGMGRGFYECAKPVPVVHSRRVFSSEEPQQQVRSRRIFNTTENEEIAPAREIANRRSIMAMLKKPQQKEEVTTTRRKLFKE